MRCSEHKELQNKTFKNHLQSQCLCNLRCAHQLATQAEAAAAGCDTSTAQLRQSIYCAFAHAHVVGGDPGSQAL